MSDLFGQGGGGQGGGKGGLGTLDPRVRVLAAPAFALVILSLSSLSALSAGVGLALILLSLSGLPPLRTLKRMVMMDSFIIFMLVLLPFTLPGEPVFSVFGLSASWEGLLRTAEIGLKANAVVLALMALVGGMDPTTLGHALARLKVPATLVHLLLFTVRYIDVIQDEYARMRAAMKCRGFRPSNSRHTYRTFGYLIGMLLVRSLERSERILEAMKCRGFTGRFVLLDRFAFRLRDACFALGFGVLLFVLVLWELRLVPL
ncbi:MAG: cobalt ECF transporter T component CbiQ [Rhodospirillum sp.]|nr:cobalt ECF transporter T component CbiQ [Rhodospirillum sp.]MCF8488170.1 cobalt ECF transporter T component CbiQ [Rhodospirillum sp.]